MKRWCLLIITILCLSPSIVFGEDFYFAQSQQGGGGGTSCATARAISWFNSSGNWGSGSNQISPGDTCYLCNDGGTITTPMTTQGSGSSGNEITIKPAPGETVTLRHISINHNYVILDGVDPTVPNLTVDSAGQNNELGHAVWVEGDYCIVRNCYVTESPWGGIRLHNTADYCTVEHNQCYHNGQHGIEIAGTHNIVQYNKVWESVQHHHDDPDAGWGGDADAMRVFGSGHIIRGNYIPYPAKMSDPENTNPHIDAFQTFNDYNGAATNCTFEYNYVIHHQDGHYVFMWENTDGPNYIRYNVFVSDSGFNAYDGNGTHTTITNNTWIGDCAESYDTMACDSRSAYTIWKNNLTVCYRVSHRTITNSTGRVVDYNWLYDTNGSVSYGAPSLGAHSSRDSDPGLNNLSGGQYWPISGSGLIDSGDDLGTQRGLHPASSWTSWPINIVTADQDSNGNGWEIGAYVYVDGDDPPAPPTGLTILGAN